MQQMPNEIPDLRQVAQMHNMQEAMARQFVAETAQDIYARLVSIVLEDMYNKADGSFKFTLQASLLRDFATIAKDTAPFLAEAFALIAPLKGPDPEGNGEAPRG